MTDVFDLLIDDLTEELKNKDNIDYRLRGFANANKINIDSITLRRYVHKNISNYICQFRRDRRLNEVAECDYLSDDEDELDDRDMYVVTGHSNDPDIRVAINKALIDLNKWDRCQDCSVYVSKTIDNKCISCILNAKIISEKSEDEIYECVVCKMDKLVSNKKKLQCGHDEVCQNCIKKILDDKCPLCRQVL